MGQRGGEDRVQVLWTLDSSQRGEEVLGDNGSTGTVGTVPYFSQVPVLLPFYPWYGTYTSLYIDCTVLQYQYHCVSNYLI